MMAGLPGEEWSVSVGAGLKRRSGHQSLLPADAASPRHTAGTWVSVEKWLSWGSKHGERGSTIFASPQVRDAPL